MLDTQLLNNVYRQIIDDINNEKISLPRVPSHVVLINNCVNDETKSINDLVKLIEAEPSLIARIMQIANSTMYGSISKVKNINQAVTRLGMAMTRNIIIALSLRDVFKSTNQYINQKLKDLWNESIEITAFAVLIARKYPKIDNDVVFIGSMLQNIGYLAISGYWLNNQDKNINEKLLLEDIGRLLNPLLGKIVLEKWNFPEEIISTFQDVNIDMENYTKICPADIIEYAKLFLYSKKQNISSVEFDNFSLMKKIEIFYEDCKQIEPMFVDLINQLKQPFANC